MRGFRGYLIRRVVLMVLTAWLVLTLAFVLFSIKPDPNKALVLFGAGPSEEAQKEALQAYRRAHNYDIPVLQRYKKWMLNYATLKWGTTLQGIPIGALIGSALGKTLTYLIPSIVISTITALSLGTHAAMNRGGFIDKLSVLLAYGGYGIPAFFAAEIVFSILVHRYEMLWIPLDTARAHQGVIVPTGVDEFILPTLILTSHLIAIQLMFIRSEVIEQLNAEYIQTLVASGARNRDLARHALRNAAIPLIASFFAQLLTILYLDIIAIEVAIGPNGFGALTFKAFTNQDLGLILGVTLVPVFVGLVGNFCQDLAFTMLDPRVEFSGGADSALWNRLPDVDIPAQAQTVVAVIVAMAIIASLSLFPGLFGIELSGDGMHGGTTETPTVTPEPGLDVRIGYDGPWHVLLEVSINGSYESRSFDGAGNEIIEINDSAEEIRVVVRKRDGSTSKLVVQIVHSREVIASKSTAESYGAVQLVEPI